MLHRPCFPDCPLLPGNSSYLTRENVENSKNKTPADPMAFLLAALVSNHLQLPRTRRTSNALSATTSTKKCARHPDPKATLLTSDSTAAGLPLRCLRPRTPSCPQGAAQDSEVPFCPSSGDQVRSSIRKPGSSLITALIHCRDTASSEG